MQTPKQNVLLKNPYISFHNLALPLAAAKNKPFKVIVTKIEAMSNLLTEQPLEPWWNF